MLDKERVEAATQDAFAVLTVTLDSHGDRATLDAVADIVTLRQGETYGEWFERIAFLIVVQAAITEGLLLGYAKQSGVLPEDVVRTLAIRHASRVVNQGDET